MSDHDNNQDRDRYRGSEHDRGGEQDRSGEHDNGGDKAIASAPAGGALTSIAALQTAFNSVDTTGFTRTGLPMLLFKSRENNGTWVYGHVWTAPAMQEESDSQRNVRVQSCIRPVSCGRFDRWP